jgi:hypothetical protein
MSLKRSYNDDDNNDNNSKGFSWMEDGKILSKNLLYTPLVAYLQNQNGSTTASSSKEVDGETAGGGYGKNVTSNRPPQQQQQYEPSHYMQKLSKVPKSLHESSFVSFLQAVSYDYHRNRATYADAKNNGSRPLSMSDMDSRIRQKGITLIGGGITTSGVPPSSTTMMIRNAAKLAQNRESSNQRCRRRQRQWVKVQSTVQSAILSKSIVDTMGECVDEDEDHHTRSFLLRLNEAWNDYSVRILYVPSIGKDGVRTGANDTLINNFCNKFSSLLKTNGIELTGAHVRIDQCQAHPAWVGQLGVMIGETTNTWRVAGYRKRKRPKQPSKKINDKTVVNQDIDLSAGTQIALKGCGEPSSDDKTDQLDWYFVPKRGSSLMLIIPLHGIDTKSASRTAAISTNENHSLPQSWRQTLIPLPDEAICVVLDS